MTWANGVVNEIDHGYEAPLSGGTDVVKQLVNQLLIEQGRKPTNKTNRIASESKESFIALGSLLAFLRAVHWSHWTSHWQVSGPEYYGDHLLFERLYTGVQAEIDAMAEKLVAYYGPEAVELTNQVQMTALLVNKLSTSPDPVQRGLRAEEILQEIFKQVYDKISNADDMTLGLDDFIMAMANDHETNVYLLRQRLRTVKNANEVLKKNPQFFDQPRHEEVAEFAESGAISNNEEVVDTFLDETDLTRSEERSEELKVKRTPPTPDKIIKQEPDSPELSTLSRYKVKE